MDDIFTLKIESSSEDLKGANIRSLLSRQKRQISYLSSCACMIAELSDLKSESLAAVSFIRNY